MELDEMKQAWQQLNQQLSRQQALHETLFRERKLDRLRHGLRPLKWGQSIQLAFGIFFLLLGVDFWVTHAETLHTVLWGVSVQLFGVLMIVFAARILHLVQHIDYALPVVEIQRRLAQLRAWRVRIEAPVFSVVGAVIWIPLILILIQYDWDGIRPGHTDFLEIVPNLLTTLWLSGGVSLALVFVVYALLRRFGRQRWLEDQFAGSAVRKAEAVLDEIVRFESNGA